MQSPRGLSLQPSCESIFTVILPELRSYIISLGVRLSTTALSPFGISGGLLESRNRFLPFTFGRPRSFSFDMSFQHATCR